MLECLGEGLERGFFRKQVEKYFGRRLLESVIEKNYRLYAENFSKDGSRGSLLYVEEIFDNYDLGAECVRRYSQQNRAKRERELELEREWARRGPEGRPAKTPGVPKTVL